jgi:methyl-accepting chemotaxis protein
MSAACSTPSITAISTRPNYGSNWRKGQRYEGEFRHACADATEHWLKALFLPVGELGTVVIMTDITASRRSQLDLNGKNTAIERALAVVEFDLQGKLLRANDNFLGIMGYTADEYWASTTVCSARQPMRVAASIRNSGAA